MVKFKIRAHGVSKKWFWVYVYDSVRQLRKETKVYDTSVGLKDDGKSHLLLGCCHSYERVAAKGKRTYNDIGIVRLAKRYLSSEIVSHEIVHAALWNYRVEYGTDNDYEGTIKNANFGQGVDDHEELFADIYGNLFRSINLQLHNYKLWK